MPRTSIDPHTRKIPSRKDAAVFRFKAALLRLRRSVRDRFLDRVERHPKRKGLVRERVVASSVTALWTETEPAERFLVAGKIQNLRLAIRALDGVEVPAGKTFSFWKQVGRAGRFRGFVEGRELREGCVIPNVGGGLCQLSNALYDAALDAGFEIVERHAHSQIIPGSLAEKNRDATVFWNYIDLRFRSENSFRIEARMDADNLYVTLRGERAEKRTLHKIFRGILHTDAPNSCATCEVGNCHRVVKRDEHRNFGRVAYLLDEFSPEFDKYVREHRGVRDALFIPLDGGRFKKANYAWTTAGFGNVSQSLFVTAKRSYRSRKLAAQGAARQQNLLRTYDELAESYARKLRYDVLHLVVQQSLLPYLWRSGHLGGRTFDVLMTALPMSELQKRLDRANRLHPASTTLSDFRADPDLVEAESEALRHARKIVTTHSAVAELFPDKTTLLDWETPATEPRPLRHTSARPTIVFPASTVGRKGCYELREALRGLDVRLILLGAVIESTDFWDGFEVEKGGANWLEDADLVVLPAFVEHRPRRLLAAAAAGVAVIASTACGVANVAGVEVVEAGDAFELRERIVAAVARKSAPIGRPSGENILAPASN